MTERDRLSLIFEMRESFMNEISNKYPKTYPNHWPVDMRDKSSQATLRETALKGVEEMFEALGHLKNWKSHRSSDVPEVDHEEFLEEIVDAFNYFLSLLILCGIDENKFFEAFMKKDAIIRDRLKSGY